jgi:hypothetical protein
MTDYTDEDVAEAQRVHREAALAGYAPVRDESGATRFGWGHVCPICGAIYEADDQHADDCRWRVLTAPPVGWVVLTRDVAGKWNADWDGQVHVDLDAARAAELESVASGWETRLAVLRVAEASDG